MTHTRLLLHIESLAVRVLRGLALLLAWPAISMAQPTSVDGLWDFRLSCSANAANGRPAFEWTARVTVQHGQFAHQQRGSDRNPYEEAWNGQFSASGSATQLRLSAQGARPNGDRWEFRFTPGSIQQEAAELTGGLYAREKGEDVRFRTCAAHMKRAETSVASGAAASPRSAGTATKPAALPAAAAAVGSDARQAVTQAAAAFSEAIQKPAADAGKASGRASAAVAEARPAPAAEAAIPKGGAAPASRQPAAASTSAAPVAAATSAVRAEPQNSSPAAAGSPGASRSRARSATEVRQALYDDPGFDLALVVPLPGSGNLKRTLEGKWTIGSGGVSVGTMGVLAADQSYDLKGFASLAPAERSISVNAPGFYKASLYHPHPVPGASKGGGFSGATPMVSTGISANPAVRAGAQPPEDLKPDQALKVALAEAIGQAMTQAIGKPVAYSLVYQPSANVILVPRHRVDPAYEPPRTEGHWITRIEKGEAVVLAYITQEQLRQGLKAYQGATAAANKQEADLLSKLQNSPAAGPESLVGAITVRTGVNVKPCALKSESDWAPYLLKHEPIGAWITKGAPKWSHEAPQAFDSAEALFDELKSGRRCTAVFGRGPMIAQLAAALDRDRVGNLVYPQPQPQKVVLGLKAQALGFDDLSALEFAESLPTRDPQQVKALRALGAGTKALVDQARERLKKYDAQAVTRLDVLIALLQDEADARKQGVTIEKLQAARAARDAKEAKAAAAAQKERDKTIAKEFPYVAQLRCRIGTQTVNLLACLTDGGVDTEVELRNGSDYRMYKVHDAQSLGNWSNDGVTINLRSAFALKAQNASGTAVLDVVIRERLSGSVKFQKSAARFGVVSVQN